MYLSIFDPFLKSNLVAVRILIKYYYYLLFYPNGDIYRDNVL